MWSAEIVPWAHGSPVGTVAEVEDDASPVLSSASSASVPAEPTMFACDMEGDHQQDHGGGASNDGDDDGGQDGARRGSGEDMPDELGPIDDPINQSALLVKFGDWTGGEQGETLQVRVFFAFDEGEDMIAHGAHEAWFRCDDKPEHPLTWGAPLGAWAVFWMPH